MKKLVGNIMDGLINMDIEVNNQQILIASDCHCKYDKLDIIKNKYPEIKTRFFLGDLFSFTNEQNFPTLNENNKGTAEWLKKNINDWHFCLGNHDLVVIREWWKYGLDQETYNLVSTKFKIYYKLLFNGKKYLLLHSKPKSLWDFINPNEYTERDFQEDFPEIDDYYAVIGGHTHKQCVHNFVDTDCVIWQVGDVRNQSKYAILAHKGIEFKKI